MGEDDKNQVSPKKWPGKWVREESFWREMTTRTLSGLLVGALLALAAVSLGFGDHQFRIRLLQGFGIFAVVFISGIILALVIQAKARKK